MTNPAPHKLTPAKLTPMMRQYQAIKAQHQDCVLFFRLGDFYEMFFEDALASAPILKITLTSRGKTENDKIPMCVIPYHSAEGYIQKLLKAGKKIAICEQMEDPAESKGIVERKVVQIITPALRPHDETTSSHHYLAAITLEKKEIEKIA